MQDLGAPVSDRRTDGPETDHSVGDGGSQSSLRLEQGLDCELREGRAVLLITVFASHANHSAGLVVNTQ